MTTDFEIRRKGRPESHLKILGKAIGGKVIMHIETGFSPDKICFMTRMQQLVKLV